MAVVGVRRPMTGIPPMSSITKIHLRYPVKVFPVNPRGGDLHGERILPRYSGNSRAVDLVLIAVRADAVPGVLGDCIASGAGRSGRHFGGFAEGGSARSADRIASMAGKPTSL